MTMLSCKVGGCWLCFDLEMNEYLFGFQSRYVDGTGQLLIYAMTLWPQQDMGLMMMINLVHEEN